MKRYLKPNVVIEPLVERWYAWAHLLSPATAAMNIRNRHVAQMRSYLRAPAAHAAAASNPAMVGGPFFAYSHDRSAEVQGLLDQTLASQADHIAFAEAVHALTRMLEQVSDGETLERLYEQVPEPLRGLVELVYDIDHRPGFRFFETLLYHSTIQTQQFQELLLYSIAGDTERDFILTTPRLPDSKKIFCKTPFSAPAVTYLSSSRWNPVDVNELANQLNVSLDQRDLFDKLFQEESPKRTWTAPAIDEVRVRYFGHACLLIETATCSIITDPMLSYEYGNDLPRFTYSDIPDVIDYLLLTHNHQDHVICETLLQLRGRVRNVIVPRDSGGALQDPSLRLVLRNLGFDSVLSLGELDTVEIDGGVITGVPFVGEHGDLDVRSKLCYLVKIGSRRILLAVDTRVVDREIYRRVRDVLGGVDTLFLGMECAGAPLSYLYAPLMTYPICREADEERRLNGSGFKEAQRLVDCFGPNEVYVYALGQEPWLQYIMGVSTGMASEAITESDQLIAYCQEQGIDAERPYACREWLYPIETNLTVQDLTI